MEIHSMRAAATTGADFAWRCIVCGATMSESSEKVACERCDRAYPIRDNLIVVQEQMEHNNRVARDFYNSPLWPLFRFWEQLFILSQGGERPARDQILRNLPQEENLRLLDVAVGDGVYLEWLPQSWSIVGVDISASQLSACREKVAGRDVRLVLGEAEHLPLHDGQFDAAVSMGGFNHFNDPEAALREMARVVRPGGKIVVSDEAPAIFSQLPGHKYGIPCLMLLERWVVSDVLHLGAEFTNVLARSSQLDIAGIARKVLADSHFSWIWGGGGYILTGTSPG